MVPAYDYNQEDSFPLLTKQLGNPYLTLVKLPLVGIYFILTMPVLMATAQSVVYPCSDTTAVSWIRDPHRCDIYYICQFGQPLPMPACPRGQIWSNAAHNCVPENSRWDDCPINWHQLKSTGKLMSFLDPQKTSNSSPDRRKMRYRNPDRPKMFQDKRVLTDDQDFWDNLLIAVENFLTTVEANSPTTVTTESPRDSNTGGHDFWKSTFTTRSTTTPMHSKDNSQLQRLVTSDTHNVDNSNSKWADRQEYPQYKRLARQWEDISKNSKSRWFTQLEDGNNSDKDGTYQQENENNIFGIPEDNPCKFQAEGLFPHPRNCHWYFNCSSKAIEKETLQRLENRRQRRLSYVLQKTKIAAYPGDSKTTSYNPNVGFSRGRYRSGQEEGFILMEPIAVTGVELFVWECRYPQLFDEATSRCREFLNVDCRGRFEPYDQCEYSVRQCPKESSECVPCENQFGQCRGRENGVYPLQGPNSWSPVFITCYLQRNIAKDECRPPKPVFSPQRLDCVSLLEVPKQHGGFQPDCTSRADGYYPDEQGRCAIFFRCALGHFRGYDECPPGSVFDPAQLACETYSEATQPCGMGQTPACTGRMDGLFADPYGRCTHYFQCKTGEFQQYHTCDLGIFDPLTHRCVVAAELTMRPCGLQPSPCEALPTGLYPDQATGCGYFIECFKGVLLTNGSCPTGTVFSALTGHCDNPELAPPPCGTSDVCLGRADGRYSAPVRGCSFYFECQHGQFTSLRRCTADDGGYFFNPETGGCDYPQNICPPCGYRWWGCHRTYRLGQAE